MAATIEMVWATALIYRDCAVKASKALVKNWLILPASCAAYFAFMVSATFLSPMGFAGGMILGMIQIFLVSLYYGWLWASVERDKLTRHNLLQFDYSLFSSAINVAFVLFIAQFIVQSFAQSAGHGEVMLFLQLAIIVIFNAVPEVIYVHRYDGMLGLSEAGKFTRDNWIEWYLPLVAILLPWILLSPQGVVLSLAKMHPLLPAVIVLPATSVSLGGLGWVALPVGIIVLNWFMIFRGFLFRELESGSRRQRIYAARNR